ncbi:MAG: hypothetical protein ACRCT2_06305, partial [Plesiomonas shigelloides]
MAHSLNPNSALKSCQSPLIRAIRQQKAGADGSGSSIGTVTATLAWRFVVVESPDLVAQPHHLGILIVPFVPQQDEGDLQLGV